MIAFPIQVSPRFLHKSATCLYLIAVRHSETFAEKRKVFDQYGEEGLKAGFGGGGGGGAADGADMGGARRFSTRDPNDIFRQFFQSCMPPAPTIPFLAP